VSFKTLENEIIAKTGWHVRIHDDRNPVSTNSSRSAGNIQQVHFGTTGYHLLVIDMANGGRQRVSWFSIEEDGVFPAIENLDIRGCEGQGNGFGSA
jgi:hypothetical protein